MSVSASTIAVRVVTPEPWHEQLVAALPGAVLTTTPPPADAGLVIDLRPRPEAGPSVWAFEIGLGGHAGVAQPGVRELVAGQGVCEVRLVRVLDGGVAVLRRGLLALRGDSPHEVAEDLRQRLVDWPRWALADPSAWASTELVAPLAASPLPSVPALLPLRRRLRRRHDELLLRERWTIGRSAGVSPAALAQGAALGALEWAPPHPHGYYADPFVLPGTDHLLAELLTFDQPARPATLHELVWSPGGQPQQVADGPRSAGHLSYPSAFTHDGTTWCVPESAGDGEVALWRLGEHGWERVCRLLDVPGVDADLVQHHGRWWLFYGVEGPDKDEELHLASAAELTGPYAPHPLNPVVRDVSAARGGGRPFVVDGVLHRPAQDCSASYGGALAIAAVERLTTDAYTQRVVRRIAPQPPYADGLHTLNAWGDGVVVDGKRHERAWGALVGKAAQRVRPRGPR